MKKQILVLWLSCLLALLAGCAARPVAVAPAPGVEINGIVIQNLLAYTITDVQVLAPASGNFVSCGTVRSGTACSTGFPNRTYSSAGLLVTWKEHGVAQSTDEFVVEIEDSIDTQRMAQMNVMIFSPGQAGARLVQ